MYNMIISIGSYKMRLEIVILCIFLFWILFGHLLCSCSNVSLKEGLDTFKKMTKKEGFMGSNNSAYGPEFKSAKGNGYIMNPDSWAMPTLTYTPGTNEDAGVQSILNRKPQKIPLPKGELSLFANTEFKGECCPNAYSTSTGCACMDVKTYDYLRERGGNNVPYSEY